MKQDGKASRLRAALAVSMSTALVLVIAALLASTTAFGSASLRGMTSTLARTLHAAGLLNDVQAGGGGGGGLSSTSSGPATTEPAIVTIGSSADLTARVFVAVPVTVSCAPLPGGPVAFGGVSVQVFQAEGRTVLTGSGFVSLPPGACNNAANPYTVDVFPQVTASGISGVFHGGPAAATANAFACDSSNDCAFGSAPAKAISISG